MAMSCDPRSKFQKKNYFFLANSAINIGKSCKISSRKAIYFRSYQPKTSQGVETPPVLLGLRVSVISLPAGSISECIISKHLGAIFVFIFQNSCWISPIFTGWLFFDTLIEITYCMYIINYSIKPALDLAGQVQSHQYRKLQKAFS